MDESVCVARVPSEDVGGREADGVGRAGGIRERFEEGREGGIKRENQQKTGRST